MNSILAKSLKFKALPKMAFTEIVLPSLKQDQATKDQFISQWPSLLPIISSASGMIQSWTGQVISQEPKGINSFFQPVLFVEWTDAKSLTDFLVHDDFKAFGAKLKPLAAAPAQPELFETDVSPEKTLSHRLIEVFRIKTADEEALARAKEAWKNLITEINTRKSAVYSLRGTRVFPGPGLLVGCIGWDASLGNDGLQIRSEILNDPDVSRARSALESLDGADSFLAKFPLL